MQPEGSGKRGYSITPTLDGLVGSGYAPRCVCSPPPARLKAGDGPRSVTRTAPPQRQRGQDLRQRADDPTFTERTGQRSLDRHAVSTFKHCLFFPTGREVLMTALGNGKARTSGCPQQGNREPIARDRPSRRAAAADVVPGHRREQGGGPSRRAAPRTRVAVTGTRHRVITRGSSSHRMASWMLSEIVCAGRFQ